MKVWARGIAFAVVIVLLLGMILPLVADAASYGGYGYGRLTDSQKVLYGILEENVGSLVCPINLPVDVVQTLEEDYLAASQALSWDYPQYFYFVPGAYNAVVYPDGTAELTYFTMSGGTINEGITDSVRSEKSKLDSKVRSIVSGAPSGATAYEKSVYVHDYIVSHVSYGYSSNDQTAYGALCEGKSVCAGYADAYMLIMNKLGVKTRVIEGTANGGAHAWNVSYIDGQCVYTDCTWDDNGGYGGKYAYLNVSGNFMKQTHRADSAFSSLFKSCDHSFPYTAVINATQVYIGEQTAIELTLGKGMILEPTILPTDVTDKSWVVTTDNPAVIAVDGNAFYAVGKGTANVTFTSGDGCASATLSVTVISDSEIENPPQNTEPETTPATTPTEPLPEPTTPPETVPTTEPDNSQTEPEESKGEEQDEGKPAIPEKTTPPTTERNEEKDTENEVKETVPTTSAPVEETEPVSTAPAATEEPTKPVPDTSSAEVQKPAQNTTTGATEPESTTDAYHDIDDEEAKKVSEKDKWLCIGVVLLSAIAAAVFVTRAWSD